MLHLLPPTPTTQSCHIAMAAQKGNSFFPPSPYHVPGYQGFIPQYNYQFGETFGKTTYHLLTDPEVRRSPRPVLAPLRRHKFIEDFSGTNRDAQGYLPRRAGYIPYENVGAATSFPDLALEPKPPEPGSAEEELMQHMDPVPLHHPGQYVPRIQSSCRYPRRLSHHPASEEQEWRLPEIAPASGPVQLSRVWAGSKPLEKLEDVTLPGAADTMDVRRDYLLPKLPIPRVIQQKVIPGYSGFIPCLTWINGVNYIQAVKEAMNEFDRRQFMEQNPACGTGRKYPPTYWPGNRIYTSAGQIPAYMGFVPELRDTYALTFGDSTRKAYQKEQRRRAGAL